MEEYNLIEALKGNIDHLIKNEIIIIQNETFEKPYSIKKNDKFPYKIQLYNVTFRHKLRILNGFFEQLQIVKTNHIQIKGGEFQFLEITESEGIEIKTCKIGLLKIQTSTIYINGSTSSFNEININGSNPKGIIHNIKNISSKKLEVTGTGGLILKNSNIDILKLERVPHLEIYNTEFKELVLKNIGLHPQNTMNFTEVSFSRKSNNLSRRELGEMFVSNTRIKNWRIKDCDFSKCGLTINNKDVERYEFIGFNQWFKKIYQEEETDYKETEKKENIESYRALKKVANVANDKISEVYFRSKELNAYYKEISFKKNFWTKILLGLNKYTNNFGTEWGRALGLIVIFAIPLYLLYFCSTGFASDNSLYKHWGEIFLFINPIHHIELFGDETGNTFWSYLIDIVHRILNTYLYYQLIAAFRKYGKN